MNILVPAIAVAWYAAAAVLGRRQRGAARAAWAVAALIPVAFLIWTGFTDRLSLVAYSVGLAAVAAVAAVVPWLPVDRRPHRDQQLR